MKRGTGHHISLLRAPPWFSVSSVLKNLCHEHSGTFRADTPAFRSALFLA